MQADYRELEKKFEAAGQPIISILEDMHDGFLVIDHNSTIIYLNKALTKSLQIERSTVLGRKVWDVLPNVFGRKLHHQLQQAVMKKMSICFESFCEPIHKYFEWTIHPSHELISIYCKDISERKHKEEMIDTLIYYDMLTGLPNFKLFQDRLNQVIVFSKHYHESVAVLMIHLDRMKHFTDIEDFLLKEIANKLIELFAERGTVSRMSNNKFICFYQYTERTKLLDLLEKVISYLSNPILINGENCLLTPSVGISMYPFDGEDSQTLLSLAEIAMVQVQENGGNQYSFYKEEMEREINKNYMLMAELSKALMNEEFQMYYHPLIDLNTGKISSVETLLRWKHPVYGFISPLDFIPLAEEVGTIVEIGHWVLRQTCRQIEIWQKEGMKTLPVSVNLSAVQLQQGDIASIVKEVVYESNIESNLLIIEVNESVMMQNVETTINILHELKAFGVQIVIDDFGTYYSSLQYLNNFPLDMIKIDRCFVRDMIDHKKDRELVKMIIELSHQLGMKVIAEGVENKTQLELLRELECDEVQGYFYSKPMEVSEVERYVKKWGVISKE